MAARLLALIALLSIQSACGVTARGVATTRALAFLARVKTNDCGAAAAAAARQFVVGETVLGRILPQAVGVLSRFPRVFDIDEAYVVLRDDPAWAALDGAQLLEARTERIGTVLATLRQDGDVPMLDGWRDEAIAVRPSFYAPPAFIIERAAGALFGLPAYGCFCNGYVCDGNGDRPTQLWLGRRSSTKPTWPGLLDCIAAGGIAAGQSVSSAMERECAEEAGISSNLAAGLRPVGGVSYTGFNQDRWGIKSDVLFNFDLRLPRSFEPVAVDGEVEGFRLVPIAEVRRRGGGCGREGLLAAQLH